MSNNLAIVGATGLVGRTFIKVIEEYNLNFDNIILLASKKSQGKELDFFGKKIKVQELTENSFKDVDIALFSAGSEVSRIYAPIAKNNGATVVDNSSFFRMFDDVPLVVPEINKEDIGSAKIIANPNCSTITAVIALNAIKHLGLLSVRYTTFQAVSGAGQKGLRDLEDTLSGKEPSYFNANISQTCIPQIDEFADGGFTKEEIKMAKETRKILHLPGLRVSATCVRVPVPNSHAVAVAVELKENFEIEDIYSAFSKAEGLKLIDEPINRLYPLSTIANGSDLTYVGRIRRDTASENGLLFYCVADNLRKGAASNAVQIAQYLMGRNT
jgi:aspartate-semialdehyde dehydrogenase